MGPESTRFHVPNSLLCQSTCLQRHIEDELSSTDRNFDRRSVDFLTKKILLYLLCTASVATIFELEVELLGLLVAFEILEVELIDEERIGNNGFVEFDEEELSISVGLVDEGTGNEEEEMGFSEIDEEEEIGNDDGGFLEIDEEEEIGNDDGGFSEIREEEIGNGGGGFLEIDVEEEIGNEDGGFLEIDEEEEELLRMMSMEEYESTWRRKRGASKSAIDGLKREKFECGCDGDESSTACVVCFDDISVGTEYTRLFCSHVFHYHCIVQWLEESNSCPICRYKIPDSEVDID